MPAELYEQTPQIDNYNLSCPDGISTIWPLPHDAKIDVAECIKIGLKNLELDDIPVNEDGLFRESQLKNSLGESVPVITVLRTGDLSVRYGLGNYVGEFVGGGSGLIDPCADIPEGQPVEMFAEWSKVSIDITVSDLIGSRANQMYLIIKYIMLAAQTDLRKFGYTDAKRVNGVDQTQVSPDSPGAGLIFTRTLSYELTHPDAIMQFPALVQLVKQSLKIPAIGDQVPPVIITDV